MCDVKTFDYNLEKPVVPDITNPHPVHPEPPVMRVLNLKQKVALMVMDAAPMGMNAAAAPAPKRDANWVKKMMNKDDKEFEEVETKPNDFLDNLVKNID